jgi:O-antigen ligase
MERQHLKPVSRSTQVAVGVAVGIAGLSCLAIAVRAFFLPPQLGADSFVLALASSLVLVLGLPAMLFSYRLVSGKARPNDGGLLGPASLRVAGGAFLVVWVVSLVQGWPLVFDLGYFGASGACFALANYRKRRLKAPRSSSAPS